MDQKYMVQQVGTKITRASTTAPFPLEIRERSSASDFCTKLIATQSEQTDSHGNCHSGNSWQHMAHLDKFGESIARCYARIRFN